jgi:ABC-type transporter MlaC component
MFNITLKQPVKSILLIPFLLYPLYSAADAIMQTNETMEEKIIDSPDLIIESLITELLTIPTEDFATLVPFLHQTVAPYLDFDYMTQWIAAKEYRKLNQQQKQQLKTTLTRFVLTSISERFNGYQSNQIQFLPIQDIDLEQASSTLLIQEMDGQIDSLTFRFYATQQGWKIFDITHNGHSLLQAYRHHFDKI